MPLLQPARLDMDVTSVPSEISGLRSHYRSGADNLAKDFFQPCLACCTTYSRAAGFFSSSALVTWSHILPDLARKSRDVNIRLLVSPALSDEDREALRTVATTEDRERVRQEISDRIALEALNFSWQPNDQHARLRILAWMIASGHLEIRFAFPSHVEAPGLFHEKIGVFTFPFGATLAFTGSANESMMGHDRNYETLDVFRDWIPEDRSRVEVKTRQFEDAWEGHAVGLEVLCLTPKVLDRIQTIAREHPPTEADFQRIMEPAVSSPFDLWPHQIEAVQAWERAGRVGLISMATGSGKTRAALVAAERSEDLELLVISVPRTALVHQWAGEIRKHTRFPSPVLVHESSGIWQDVLFNRLRAGSDGQQVVEPLVIVGTMHSLSGERFESVLADSPSFDRALLIVDEVHNAGAPMFRRVLRPDFRWRLGLSATPARHFDEEGTAAITTYFSGEPVYRYDLRRALEDGRLCPYRYYVYPAELSDQEYQEYEGLTRQIARMRHGGGSEVTLQSDNVLDGDSQEVRSLLFRRARILKRCEAKLAALEKALGKHPSRRCLIYCADNEQLELVKVALDRKKILHLIYTASTPSSERRETLTALGRGDMPVVLAIDCLDEGVDVPTVDQAIIVASSSNKRQFIQRRGRILRRAPGKTMATLIDIVAIPPAFAGTSARKMLNGELARVKEMTELADNKHNALQNIQAITSQFGVTLAGLLSGEGDG